MADISLEKSKGENPIMKLKKAIKDFRNWRYKVHLGSLILKTLVLISVILTVGILAFLLIYILVNGVPNLTADLFAWKYTSKNVSMLPSIINTFIITILSLVLAIPLGIGAAIYMVEYAKRGNKLVKIVRITTETLSGIPSIVFGLFGYLFFIIALGWSYSMLAGVITLAIMVLPLIVRTTEEALISVPDSYREGSFGLGAGKLRTVVKVILPDAIPGILSGVTLAIGRIVGETAALIFTAGTVAKIPESLFDSTSSLAVHMYVLLSEGLHTEAAYATAVVLLLFVLAINSISKLTVRHFTKNRGE
jgi:phosphate transport system permease protein